jgi:hypothetical protein
VSDVVPTAHTHIDIPGDVLIPDGEFCDVVLGGTCRRTAKRYEMEGLPFVMIRGRKFRPLNAGRTWLAARIQVQGAYSPPRRGRPRRKPSDAVRASGKLKTTAAEHTETTA